MKIRCSLIRATCAGAHTPERLTSHLPPWLGREMNMQGFLRLLRTRLERLAMQRRPSPVRAPDPRASSRDAQRSEIILSYDNFR
jgi:hypothetical protein